MSDRPPAGDGSWATTWHGAPERARRSLLAGAGLIVAVTLVACGQGGSHTRASGVFYTAVPTAPYSSSSGTPRSVPAGTPANLLATPGGTPASTPAPAPGGTPVATPGHP